MSKLKQQLNQFLKTLPKEIKRIALNHYREKFTAGNDQWEGVTWPAPIRKQGPIRLKRGKGYRKGRSPRDATRQTLVGPGRGVLKRSIRARIKGLTITFSTDVPYAQVHNEGQGNMPKRTFIGMEKDLENKIKKEIEQELRNLLK